MMRHEPEHTGYGIPFPPPGERLAMLDEACEIVKGLWTSERFDHEGRFFTLRDARCYPKPVQERIPITIGGYGPRMLRIVAKHADQWNAPSLTVPPEQFAELTQLLDERCAQVGRDPVEIVRSVQIFVFPDNPDDVRGLPDLIGRYEEAGAEHAVLSFYSPPSRELLGSVAP
jgi:alkanesulfonate monooxygenase SsuD/methylene tetrahydromethanopterin reductase-like flavin-dependent oxidoreductase (luciferase family)